MHRSTAHVLLILAALFYVSRYVAAAIMIAQDSGPSEFQYRHAMEWIGMGPLVLATICAVAGVLILLADRRRERAWAPGDVDDAG